MQGASSRYSKPPDIEGLREFSLSDDRGRSPLFSGREQEIGDIANDLGYRLKHWRRGKDKAFADATWIIQGAPGAGKTALLQRLAEILPGEVAETASVCELDSERLGNPHHSWSRIANAMNAKIWRQASESVAVTASGGVNLAVAKAATSRTTSQSTSKETAWEEFVKLAHGNRDALTPVLLFVDEIQNVPGQKGEPAAALLSSLHKATDELPVFPVYGGLATSELCLKNLGLSRLSSGRVRTLDCLAPQEIAEAVGKFCDRFRVGGTDADQERLMASIVDQSQGWPKHLHVHLQSLAGSLADCQGDLAQADEDSVRALAHKEREVFYGKQMAHPSLADTPRLAAAAVLRMDRKPMTTRDLQAAVREISDASDDPNLQLPSGVSEVEFVDGMKNAGLLHEDPQRFLYVPIPSFRRYMAKNHAVEGPGSAPELPPSA